MNRREAEKIAKQWMIPTEGSSYMGGLSERPILRSARGSTVTDVAGKEYLDFQSGQMGAALGHQHPRILRAIEEAVATMLHASNTMLNVPRLRLHEYLGRLLPGPLEKSLFLVTGSDSVEAAVDLARKATAGTDVLGLHAALHGSTSFLTRSLTFNWRRSTHSVVAPATSAILTPYCYRCPLGLTVPACEIRCLSASMELADANFTGTPAAFIGEPILSAGGVIVPPAGYFGAVRKACERRGMLLILDEAQTGLGKTGKLFGFQHEDGLTPDIIAVSKHFGGGVPISAVCTTAEVADRAVRNGYFATRSHAADPLLCTAGLESLKIVVEEKMADRARAIEERMTRGLEELAGEFELVGDIRGRGVLLGVELVTDREKKTPANREAQGIASFCLEHGLIFQLRGSGGRLNVLRFVPPMTTSHAEVDRALSILHDAFKAASRGQTGGGRRGRRERPRPKREP